MLSVKVIILVLLIFIFIQDIISRAVYWLLFPVLTVLFIGLRLTDQSVAEILRSSLVNNGFLAIQLLLVSLYFSFKKRRWVILTQNLLGWGDILFLITAAFYVSTINFLFFYTISLTVTLFFWLIWQLLVNKSDSHIPLAGLQSLMLAMFLAGDWWWIHCDLTNDNWLVALIIR